MQTNFEVLNLAIQFHQECKKLELPYYLKNQLLRNSSSVALNISEGNAKTLPLDRKRFFQIAYASNKEAQTALILSEQNTGALLKLSDAIGGSLYRLMKRCT